MAPDPKTSLGHLSASARHRAKHPRQEPEQRTETALAEAGAGIGYLASCQRGIELVNAHRGIDDGDLARLLDEVAPDSVVS